MSSLNTDIALSRYSHLPNYAFSKNNKYKFSNLVGRYIFSIKGGHSY